MSKFRNKYRVETARLRNWDYSTPGAYFITIITKNRENLFGEIKNGKMILNAAGNIVNDCWLDLPNHYKNIILDKFVIMPNHLHAIIIIPGKDNDKIENNRNINTKSFTISDCGKNKIKKQHGISEFVRALKSFSSRRIIVETGLRPVSTNTKTDTNTKINIWQPRFYDHIIRNENELNRIRKYIINNPLKWNNGDYNFNRD